MDEKKNILAQLPVTLLPWYRENKRDLPWRQDKDPYHIWLSEIMLQQTRVEAVKGYYNRFLQALPTVEALAKADDELLYKLWEGLGYYSRVRNLKKAAQQIAEQHRGEFPRTYAQILALPGVGEYTAGAVGSIAFGLKTPAGDGNVLRVVSRLTDDDTPIDRPAYKSFVRSALETVYPAEAGDFTQALMELGATVCGPNREPSCNICPCGTFCMGRCSGRAPQLPVKNPKKQRRQEDMTVFILRCGDRYALQKRPDEGLLAGLWQFPNIPEKRELQDAILKMEEMGLKPAEIIRQVEKKHIFTHVQWNMSGIFAEVHECAEGFEWMTAQEINEHAALPTAFRQFWEETGYV